MLQLLQIWTRSAGLGRGYCWWDERIGVENTSISTQINFNQLFFRFFDWTTRDFFHSFWDVSIIAEGLQILTYTDLCLEQCMFFNVPQLLWHGHTLYYGHLRGPVTYTPTFGSGAVKTYFNDLHACVSRPGIEHRSHAFEKNALPLRNWDGSYHERYSQGILPSIATLRWTPS